MECSLEEPKKIQITAFRKFYLRPRYIFDQVRIEGPILLKTIAGNMRKLA